MNRRDIVVVASILLTRCSTTTVTPSQLAQDAALIATAANEMSPSILAATNLSAPVKVKTIAAISSIQAGALKIAQDTSGQPVTSVQLIIAGIQVVASILLAAFPPTAIISVAVHAMISLVPAIASAVGLSSAGAPPPMSAEQARAVLGNYRG